MLTWGRAQAALAPSMTATDKTASASPRLPIACPARSVLVMLVVFALMIMIVMVVTRGRARRPRLLQSRVPNFQVVDEIRRVALGQSEHRHAHRREFRGELQRDRVVLGPQSSRIANIARQPGMIATLGHAAQVRPD